MVKKTTTTETPTNGHSDSEVVQSFKASRRAAVPIVSIETTDPAATILAVRRALPDTVPFLAYDCAKGLRGLNPAGKAAFDSLKVQQELTVNATETLLACERLPENSVLFLHNFHRHITELPTLQALWNLRDVFKSNKRTAVLLGPHFTLPAELSGDVIPLSEPLPTRAQLSSVLDMQYKNGHVELPDDETRKAALDAVVGLPTFTAEQVFAMSLEKTGVNVKKCWEHKINAIENTPGLNVWEPIPNDTTIDELKGLDNVVAFAKQLVAADAFNAIVFIDEGDKALAGGMSEHTGDSGVSKDQIQQVLSYMNDTQALGLMLAGVAGTGKTQLAKAMGALSGKPVIIFDLGGMKGGVVGESEQRIRAALKMVTATAEGKVLFIMTANRTTIFTPEMNRRFPDQFFFDEPDDLARSVIWPVYVKKNRLTASQAAIPPGFDAGWTGAEIKRACERAALFGCTVVDAARWIIPQNKSAKVQIAQMRRDASGRFLSASVPGFYQNPDNLVDDSDTTTSRRAIEVN